MTWIFAGLVSSDGAPAGGSSFNCAQYSRGRRCGFGRETGEICKNSDPCGEKRKKLKKCKEKTAEKVQNFAGGGAGFAGRILRGKCAWIFAEDSAGVLRGFCAERECGASQGKSKLAPPGSSIPGRHRLAPPPLSRRQTQACHICAA